MDDDDELYAALERCLKNVAIFDRNSLEEEVPAGYTSATVKVDATPSSTLSWEKEIDAAKKLIADGYKVSFDLDLGLHKLLRNQAALQTASLALDEFRKVLLEPFYEQTEAVIFGRYSAPLVDRDEAMDFLDLLRQDLPSELPVLLLFSVDVDPFTFSRTFALDRYSLFTLAFESSPLLLPALTYNQGKSLLGYIGRERAKYQRKTCQEGLVMPRFTTDADKLKPLVDKLAQKEVKIIAEDSLAVEWEGLDLLYVEKSTLQPTTLRLLDGFEAAGGTVLVDQNHSDSVN